MTGAGNIGPGRTGAGSIAAFRRGARAIRTARNGSWWPPPPSVPQRGFDAISMADIGAEAGIVGSGIYRHFDSKTAILVAMADRVMDRLMTRAAEIVSCSLDERQSLSMLVRDHIEVALTDRDALAVYHREVRTLPEDERRRLSRSQRHYIEEWVCLLGPLRPDLADGEVRLAVHAAIGAIQSTLFFRSELTDERLTELLESWGAAWASP